MKKLVLDTSVLIRYWRTRPRRSAARAADARAWARQLIAIHETDAIVTPVYLELIGGVTDADELRLTRTFLEEFRRIDRGVIPAGDWEEATRLAQRVPRDRRPRHLGDCLIRAVARRLGHSVLSFDLGFPG